MTEAGPTVRVFAGPNGSGKSTVTRRFEKPLGVYVNADEIEQQLRATGALDLGAFGLRMTTEEARAALRASSLFQHVVKAAPELDALAEAAHVRADGALAFPERSDHPYLAAVLAEVVREALVATGASFSFETVLSAPVNDKADLLKRARAAGYRVELYYVSTVAPSINVARVRSRVAKGGHPVPEEKVVSRYTRSLENLAGAIRQSDRAYLYDNSGAEAVLVAEVADGRTFSFPNGRDVPWWVRTYAWEPLNESA